MRPAARVGDRHLCPAIDSVPHVGGPVTLGFTKVLIEIKAAARAGDLARCAGATDVIQQGSATVLIGGMPVASLSEKTVHGGVLVTGAATVFVGGPVVTPPQIEFIVKNVAEIEKNRLEIARLDERLMKRQKRMDRLDEYLKIYDEPPALKVINRILKATKPKSGLPAGATDFSEEEARTTQDSIRERKELGRAMARDQARMKQLEKETAARERGQTVTPSAPDPELETPVKGADGVDQ